MSYTIFQERPVQADTVDIIRQQYSIFLDYHRKKHEEFASSGTLEDKVAIAQEGIRESLSSLYNLLRIVYENSTEGNGHEMPPYTQRFKRELIANAAAGYMILEELSG
jgi:hypothetical protein